MNRTVLPSFRADLLLIVLACICVLFVHAASSQPSSPQPVEGDTSRVHASDVSLLQHSQLPRQDVPRWYDMFANIPNDWSRFGRISFSAERIPAVLGIGAATAFLIATDDATWKASDRWYRSSSAVYRASNIGVWIGDGFPQFGLAGAFALYGFAAGDHRALRTASQTTETILACGVVVQVLKHITGRESPVVSTAPGGVWRFFPNQIQYHKHVPHYDAYPSGHVATALATITVIAENYPEITWIRPVGYTLVGILAVSMVNAGIHWYSDYPLGLALGYTFGMLAAHPEGMEVGSTGKGDAVKFSLAPRLDPMIGGVQLTISF